MGLLLFQQGPWLSLVSANLQGKEEEQDPDKRVPKVGTILYHPLLPLIFTLPSWNLGPLKSLEKAKVKS